MNVAKKTIKKIIATLKKKELFAVPTPVNTTELLKGKVALITGGSGGIGKAIAKSFLRNGCQVIIAGTSQEKLNAVRKEIGEDTDLQSIVINLNDIKHLPAKVEEASQIFGRIDILVNSAGINVRKNFMEIDEADYDHVMNVNVKGAFFMSQAIAEYMIKNHIKGHILNISSSAALRPANSPYQISKWAIKGFTIGLADKLLPHGIIVNAIAPGPVATEMLGKSENESIYKMRQPSGRYAIPSEIAEMAVMLVSDMGQLVVGDTLYMTGGSGILTLHN